MEAAAIRRNRDSFIAYCFKLATIASLLYYTLKEAKIMHRRFHFCMILLLAALMNLGSLSVRAEAEIEYIREEAGESYVLLPALSGLDNAFVQDSVNSQIRKAMEPHLNTLLLLSSGVPGSLKADANAEVFPSDNGHHLMSVLFDVRGRQPSGRSGQSYVPLMFDLADGRRVSHEALFDGESDALAFIGELTLDGPGEGLSNYLSADDLVPIPLDRVLVRRTGLSFYYPDGSLTWLSGKSASLHYLYHELESVLDLKEGSTLSGIGIPWLLDIDPECAQKVRKTAESGILPGLDARLGDEIEPLILRHSLLYDPEGFPEGEAYFLEEDAYRGSTLISDNGIRISGILSRRMNLFGLITGRTGKAEAFSALGGPGAVLPLDSAGAQAYGLPECEIIIYTYEGSELRLCFDTAGLLDAIWLRLGGGI